MTSLLCEPSSESRRDKSMPTDPTKQLAFLNACCREGGFTQAWDTGGRGRLKSHAGESLT
ncbi:MAG: hypothetical protein QXK26_01335 [Candidatus Bathyarchaeia archaeon]